MQENPFGTIRSYLWPIHRHEWGKVIPMFLMLFFICFNYTLLRNIKDSVVITASGAEVIPFIKVWLILPAAVIATSIYAFLSHKFGQEKVFYLIVAGFISFFALFIFVLYPFREQLHPKETVVWLQNVLPVGFQGLIALYAQWTLTLFYVFSELWGTMVLSILFWSFANDTTKLKKAPRIYAVLTVSSNAAAMVAGQVAIQIGKILSLFNPENLWDQSLKTQMILILSLGVATMGIYRWLNKNILKKRMPAPSKESKKRLSFRESFSHLANCRYLLLIAVLVLSYNLVINMVEVIWKDRLRMLYPNAGDYNHFLNHLTSIIGLLSTLAGIFFSKAISRFGWTKMALCAPLVMLVTSVGFFLCLFLEAPLSHFTVSYLHTTPLAIAVFIGGAQNCLSKVAKYSLFDATKEMAFIPLDEESKHNGKAAIDGVGSRLGKSAGSLFHQGLLLVFGTISASSSYIFGIVFAVLVCWISAVQKLGKRFHSLKGEETSKKEAKPQASLAA